VRSRGRPAERPPGRASLTGGAALLLALAALALLAAPAAAQELGSVPATPVRSELPPTPEGYRLDAREALRLSDRDPAVAAEREARGELEASVSVDSPQRWEVGYYEGDEKVALVVIDAVGGGVIEAWTGDAVIWPMARGREGQFGHLLNAPWVWLPLSALFLLALVDWRRPLRIVHLDLLVLLSFGISLALFNAPRIDLSVPLAYPPLLYLLGRMLWIGFRGAGEGLRPWFPTRPLVALCALLVILRVTLNIVDSGVIDVGYAGVVGADRIADAEPIYGERAFPENNPQGDTYGPANYFAYVPFEQIFPWSGSWDALPAARAAAIFFDLLCVLGLVALGRRLGGADRGPRLGAILAFAWLAFPFTAYVLQSSSNDSLPAALVIWGLVAFTMPAVRGALIAAAGLTKFAAIALIPLFIAGARGLAAARSSPALRRQAALAGAGVALAAVLLLAHPAIDPGLATFWERTIGSQASRDSPFSIWGQAELGPLHTVLKAAVAAFALALAFVPSRRNLPQIAALAAAALIGVQLIAEHWFYLYIVWFMPPLLVAIAVGGPTRPQHELGRRA
jgi:hypothetical protein